MSNESNMRRVTAIRNGTVIDHIPAGSALRVLELLNIGQGTSVPVSLVTRAYASTCPMAIIKHPRCSTSSTRSASSLRHCLTLLLIHPHASSTPKLPTLSPITSTTLPRIAGLAMHTSLCSPHACF